jgi:hypothetical protein
MNQFTKNEAKRLRAIVGRAITKWGAILLTQYWKN